jgi:diguanylate cyclase (GGDEF)-like protein
MAFPTEIDSLLSEDHLYLYKLLALPDGSFAISSVRGGILIFDRAGRILRSINKNGGLLDNTVASIMLDRSNNLWAATNSGISHIELSVPQSIFNARHGIEGVSISSAFYQGKFYTGTFQNVYVQSPFQYSLKHDIPQFIPLREGTSEVWQFKEVSGDLLAASGRGLYRIEGDAAFKIFNSSGNAYCLAITPRWPDHVFVGLMGGVEVFKRENGRWNLLGRLEGVKENVRSMFADSDGDLWLNTEVQGIWRAHFSGSKATQAILAHIGAENGVPSMAESRVVFVAAKPYLVTPKGLFSASITAWQDGAKDKTHFSPDDTFGKSFADGSLELTDISSDGQNGVFIKSSAGVDWLQPGKAGQWLKKASPFRGLPSQDDAFFVHPDGGVWSPGESLYRVDLNQKKNYDENFSSLIRNVSSNTKLPVFDGTHGSIANIAGISTAFVLEQKKVDVPKLPYSQNALMFEFAATFYEKPGSTTFQYQLEGFDKSWSEWGSVATKEYTNIPEGQYRFRVKAKNLYGTIGQEAIYGFEILAPWYRTIWAYLLWFLLASLSLAGIVYLYTLRLRQDKIHLEELVAKRTQQLRDATLTDPLTGLRNRRFITEVLQNDVVAFVGYKNYVNSSANSREGMTGKEIFGLFLLDMDHFKHVNDTFGHDAGDHVLRQFAEILSASVRQDDVVIRLGGEEFLVVLKKTKPEYIHSFAKTLLEKVANAEFNLGDGTVIKKTCSIGYTSFPIHDEYPELISFEQGVTVADIAMYHAKHHGRNQAVFLKAGAKIPEGEEMIRKMVTHLDFSLKQGYLEIGQIQYPTPRA